MNLLPDNHNAYHYLAPLLLRLDDVAGYRQHCEAMLARFGQTSDPIIAERTAKDCLILQPPGSDVPAINRLADVAANADRSHKSYAYFQFVKGLAEYRAGRFSSASDWLQPVLAAKGDVFRAVQAHATLAMTQYQLKQTEQARNTLSNCVELANSTLPKLEKGPGDRWNDWFIAHTLMREARALIETNAASANTNSK